MMMHVLGGAIMAYGYNQWLTRVPVAALRCAYLQWWSGDFGSGTSVQMNCRFLNGRKIHFGKRNIINFGSLLDGRKFHIRMGDDVSIGPEASILTLGHEPQSSIFADRGGDVTIGNRAWIAYRAVILPGLTIGEGAVVGAGAIVTKSVEPYTIVAGNPARKVGDRNRDLRYKLTFLPWLS
jgi:maltose O-acetyltransferase